MIFTFNFMKKYLPILVITFAAAIAFLPGTRSYHVYLDRNFGEKKDCLSDLSLTFFGPTDLTPPTPPDSNAIDYLCTNFCSTDNFASRQKISSLSIINTIGALIQINLASNTDPYSSVKVELTYFGKYPITAELQYPDSKDASFAFSQASSYPFTNYASYTLDPTIVDTSFDVADASTVICPNIMKIKASTLVIAKSTITAIQSPEPALVLKLTVAGSYNLSNLRSIRVSKNCVENCLVCGSDTSCSTCQAGFVSNTFTSGITACEQVGSVCSALSNCLSCAISGADSACLSCYPGYTLSSSGTCTADTPTPASSCTATQYNRQGVCTEYSSLGYYESRYDSSLVPIKSLSSTEIQTTYKCPAGMLVVAQKENNYQNYKCKCFFADCISCSSFESCDVCSSGYIFDYSSKQCVVSAIKKSDLSIKQNVTYTGYTFKISFSNGIQYSSLKASDISVSITDFTAFTYSLIGIKNGKTIDISVACNKLVKHKKITITFTNFAFVSANGLNQSSVSTDLEPFLNLSQVEYNRAKLAKTIAQVIATIIVWFLIPIAFLGYFSTMMIKIDVIAFLYYVLFISIRFPINLTSFAQAFKILQLDFVINFFGSLVNTNTFLDSAVQWMKQSTDCYFLASTGQSISVFTVVIGLYLFTKMMANMDFAYISDYFKKAVIRTWEFGGILNGVWLVFIYVVVGVFLQFQDLSCNDSSCSLNYTLMAFSGVIAGIIPILVFCLVRYAASVTYESYLVMKLASLLTGIRLFAQKDLLVIKEENQFKLEIEPVKKQQQQQQQSQTEQQQQIFFCSSLEVSQMNKRQKLMFTWTKYVIPILYVRKVVFALIICFLYNYPYLQIAAISVINFAGASYFMIIQPFTEKYQNLKAAISELMLIVFQGLAALLISDGEDQSEDTRILIGWGMILIASLLILWHAISIIVQFGKVVRTYYLNWKQQRSRAKIVSLQVDDQSSNNSPDIKRKPILQFQDYSSRDNPKGNNQNSGNCEEHPAEEEDDATNNQSPPKKGGQGQIMQQLFLNSGQKSQDNLLMYSPKRVRNSKLSIIAGHQESQPQSFYDLPQSSNQVQDIIQSSNQAKMISLKEKAK